VAHATPWPMPDDDAPFMLWMTRFGGARWVAIMLALICAPTNLGAQQASPTLATSSETSAPLQQVEARFRAADNVVEFGDRRALGRFFLQWDRPEFTAPTIAHFGDSHVQLGWMIAPVRDRLQRAKGNGGRGMIFPYALAHTYSQEDYVSSFTGHWQTANSIQQPPKLSVGVSGFVGITKDPVASITIDFTKPLTRNATDIRLYANVADAPYQIRLDMGSRSQVQQIMPNPAVPMQTISFATAALAQRMTITIQRDDAVSKEQPGPASEASPAPAGSFALYGIDLRSQKGGLVYHNLGVGGANYIALLQQRLFAEQYRLIRPDLVILDWGTNDIIYKNIIPVDHAQKVVQTIQRIRAIDPQVSILLTSVQDMNYKGRNVSVAADYARLMRRIALEQDCLFFDWYLTSGGPDTMRLWEAAKLASKDNIHLNGRGYRKRGEALADAIEATLKALHDRPGLPTLRRSP
jgi:lysophospholipase L1-like esterase